MIEFKVKIPHTTVMNFLVQHGVNADTAVMLSYSKEEHRVIERNRFLRTHILKMMETKQ